jgi:sugar (pentulose or hexulose) kinase
LGLPVYCGIHDSNASLLPHLLDQKAPFAVVSSGTWMVCFAVPGTLEHLDAARDCLANVDAFGRPVPSARFMGGREYAQLLAASAGDMTTSPLDPQMLQEVLRRQLMVLPAIVPGSGPFPQATGGWRHDADATPALRHIAGALYLALMTETCLGLIGAGGPIMIEGPAAGNVAFCHCLAALTGRVVQRCLGTTGTSSGAALLAATNHQRKPADWPRIDPATLPIDQASLRAYAAYWRHHIPLPAEA